MGYVPTTNYGFQKPEKSNSFNVDDLNNALDKADAVIKTVKDESDSSIQKVKSSVDALKSGKPSGVYENNVLKIIGINGVKSDDIQFPNGYDYYINPSTWNLMKALDLSRILQIDEDYITFTSSLAIRICPTLYSEKYTDNWTYGHISNNDWLTIPKGFKIRRLFYNTGTAEHEVYYKLGSITGFLNKKYWILYVALNVIENERPEYNGIALSKLADIDSVSAVPWGYDYDLSGHLNLLKTEPSRYVVKNNNYYIELRTDCEDYANNDWQGTDTLSGYSGVRNVIISGVTGSTPACKSIVFRSGSNKVVIPTTNPNQTFDVQGKMSGDVVATLNTQEDGNGFDFYQLVGSFTA